MSAAAVATSAALAVYGVEGGTADAASPMTGASAPAASQLASVPAVSGVKTVISPPVSLHGELFYGTAASGGGKLWESNGTPAGTKLIKQIKGRSDAAPTELTNVAGHLWFEADGELWKSNGTAASTVLVDAKVDPTAIVDGGGTVFFETASGLWKSKGTQQQTTEVKALKTLGKKAPNIVAVSGRVYFTVPNSGEFEYGTTPDLWTSNGTPAGTMAVRQTHIESVYAQYPRLYNAEELTNVGGHLYFSADTNLIEASYSGLWEASGGSAKQVEPYGTDLTNVGGSLYFFDFEKPHNCNSQEQAEEGGCTASTGFALWKGTTPLDDFSPTTNVYDSGYDVPYVGNLTGVGGALFFAANDGSGPTELWTSDGTAAGTSVVDALAPTQLTNVDGTLLFTANDGTGGTQVWESNGTGAGTTALTNFPATTTTPGDLVNVGGTLYFTANDGTPTGYGLWKLSTDPQ